MDCSFCEVVVEFIVVEVVVDGISWNVVVDMLSMVVDTESSINSDHEQSGSNIITLSGFGFVQSHIILGLFSSKLQTLKTLKPFVQKLVIFTVASNPGFLHVDSTS